MKWLMRWLFAIQPRFRSYDGCDLNDLARVCQLADLLDAREAADAKQAGKQQWTC
jgi:hypothetical protein